MEEYEMRKKKLETKVAEAELFFDVFEKPLYDVMYVEKAKRLYVDYLVKLDVDFMELEMDYVNKISPMVL